MELPKTGDLLLGKYLLEKSLGEGGMGVVYSARHDLLGQRVAVKLIRPEYAMHRDAVARFINEARAAARIENEHVARVLDVGMLDDCLPYMVLEYLDGADLATVLRGRGPLPIADAVDYLLQAIEAVAHAHALGIVHRDLKPSNLFLARRPDGTSRLKVLDFGIAKVVGAVHVSSANMTRTDSMLGTPLYMSPEQLLDAKSVDRRCDIWALGVVAYELLTGRPPFLADNAVALFAAIRETDPVSMRVSRVEVSAELDDVILKCLRRVPDDCYSTVTELASCLAPFGTAISAAAFENARRILPLEDKAASQPHQSVVNTAMNTLMNTAKPAPKPEVPARPVASTAALQEPDVSAKLLAANTADPWATSRPDLPPPPRKRATVIGLGAVLAATLVITGMLLGPRLFPRTTDAAAAAAAASSSSPIVTAPSAPTSQSSASALPSSTPSSVPSVQPAVIAKPQTTPAPSHSTAPRPTGSVVPAAASARPNCNQPFEFDADGKRKWKRECL